MSQDRRLTQVRHLDLHYDFPGYARLAEWQARAAEMRLRVLVSTGLFPLPQRTPLKARVFGKVERDGYSVEKVYFQSRPGFYVAGNLYRPLGKPGPFPGIVSPHGHWKNGRTEDIERGSVPGRCLSLARQGHVVFSYDMIGYNDSLQVGHRDWGAPQEELWGISPMGLQLWNSIRAVDFLESLPEVDPDRLGCTGASGGGTQTFMLTAVDDRIKVSAPVNMLSAYMQGGCICENAPSLRTDLYNVELGALMAPRPLLMVCATGDWTKHTPVEEYPDIRSVYELFGAADKVATVQIDAEHNYNKASREAVYAWFGRWFLNDAEASHFREQPFKAEPPEALRVFASKADLPAGALTRAQLIRSLIDEAEAQLDAARPRTAADLNRFREQRRPAWRQAFNVPPEDEKIITFRRQPVAVPEISAEELVIGRKGRGDRVRCLLLHPAVTAPATAVLAVLAHPRGIAGSVGSSGPKFLSRRLLQSGISVLAVDCFLPEGTPDPRDLKAIRYFTTYNTTDTANRVLDLRTALLYVHSRKDLAAPVLVGIGEAGLWALLTQAAEPLATAVVADAAQFNTNSDAEYLNRLFVPHLRRLGDFRTAAVLTSPTPLLLHNTAGRFDTSWWREAYALAGNSDSLSLARTAKSEAELVKWITGPGGS